MHGAHELGPSGAAVYAVCCMAMAMAALWSKGQQQAATATKWISTH
jgi:hypothetical protein